MLGEKEMPVYKEHKDRLTRIRSAITAIKALLPLDLYPAHKKELLSTCIWKITEADGKDRVRYWSDGAIANPKAKLQHEHVNQRQELVSRLISGEAVENVVQDADACMVTEHEHRMLGRSNSKSWQRYKDSGIKVFDALEQKWCW